MAIKSISDLDNFSLFIFDLDNTIYNEEDYLFQAYLTICSQFAGMVAGHDKNSLFEILMNIYRLEGREKLFDKFLATTSIDKGYLDDCLNILRTFNPEKKIEINGKAERFLRLLKEKHKKIFVLTNGNPDQQRNKIRNIVWNGLDEKIEFVFANEIEPKPSPAGVLHILKATGIAKDKAVFIGDSDVDLECAVRGEIKFVNIADLTL